VLDHLRLTFRDDAVVDLDEVDGDVVVEELDLREVDLRVGVEVSEVVEVLDVLEVLRQ